MTGAIARPHGVALLVAAALLALAGAAVLAWWWRGRRRADRSRAARGAVPATGTMFCPACRKEFPQGARFCPHDAQPLAPLDATTARRAASASVCPRCRRAFEAHARFCPYDATELLPAGFVHATRGPASVDPTSGEDVHERDLGGAKICPICSAKYGASATFCGRDGSELMSVN